MKGWKYQGIYFDSEAKWTQLYFTFFPHDSGQHSILSTNKN